MRPCSILVDLDMVIADFNAGFEYAWRSIFPDRDVIPLSERKYFHLTTDYLPEYKTDIEKIINEEGFISSLPSIPGALDGMQSLMNTYEHVRICTSALKNSYCLGEKWTWVRDRLGEQMADTMIICKDKTSIMADVLIDDRPESVGHYKPMWKYVIFDQPYNRDVTGIRFMWGQDYNFATL